MRVFLKGAALVVVAALFPIVGSAQQGQRQGPPQGPPPPGGGRGMARGEMVRQGAAERRQRPQLTNEQREQLRAFDEQQRAAGETARRELGDLHRQLNESLTAAQIDTGKVSQLRSAIVQRETTLAQQRVDRLARVASVLTAEQRQSMRGRGLGELLGPGRAGGRGGAIAGPRGGAMAGARGQRRAPEMQMRGRMLQRQPLRGGRANDARLRAEIQRLETQLEALRRRIGR